MNRPSIQLSPAVSVHVLGQPASPPRPGALAFAQAESAAFGDGSHPTTRLCAGAVDLLCRQRPGLRVLDVGTGTGILARIARARGASEVRATDIDPVALAAAVANVALDGAPVAIPVTSDAPDAWGARFDLVVANILEAPLRALAPALARALRPGGTLLLSGFTSAQVPGLQVAFAAHAMRGSILATGDGWVLLGFSLN